VEMLAGAGDASLGLTVERIEFLNGLALDGVVVLPPYLMAFNQTELIDYYRHLADASLAPVFLYDLPILTRCKIALDTVLTLARHPNIAGIKCSDEPGFARQVRDEAPEGFRVIPAAPTLMDALIASGFDEHLDGVYCLCPEQITALGEAATNGRRDEAARFQQGLNRTLRGLQKHEVWRPFTALMHEIGVEGRFKPRPHRDWDANETKAYLESVEGRDALAFIHSAKCELTPRGR
jgi:4-hydroxy-tetrahydrodipicolinate synthase